MIASMYWTMSGPTPEWSRRYGAGTEFYQWTQYWVDRGEAVFVVPEGSLVFSVIVFTCCACTCLGILALRRMRLGGELGGPPADRFITGAVLFFLWILYVLMSILYEYGVVGPI